MVIGHNALKDRFLDSVDLALSINRHILIDERDDNDIERTSSESQNYTPEQQDVKILKKSYSSSQRTDYACHDQSFTSAKLDKFASSKSADCHTSND